MERYLDLSGDSGVAGYVIGDEVIDVWFKSGQGYRYGSGRPGPRHVERMKTLARRGRGLATYISRHVADCYERKL